MNIDQLTAGRELDERIAKVVMGWKRKSFAGGGGGFVAWVDGEDKICASISSMQYDRWSPSTNISDAWQVVDKISEFGLYNIMQAADFWMVDIVTLDKRYYAEGLTAPEAICKVALKAILGGESE